MYQEEHKIFRDAFRKFLQQEVTPHVNEWEEKRVVPREAWEKMGAAGYLCPWLPEEYGGSGADFLFSVIVNEELARVGAVGFFAPLHSDIVAPYLYHLGTEEQKKRWLPGCAKGTCILAVAMTEPDAGSDLAAMRTKAERDGDFYVINGTKTFISNGIQADLVIVACRTDPEAKPSRGVSLLMVERGTPGFERGRKLNKMGLHSQDTAELLFEDCRVPVDHLLGKENNGFVHLMQMLQQERLVCCIMAQAMAEAMIEMTINYCRERKAFGQPIASFQHNAFKIVDMVTEIKVGRVFLDHLIQKHLDDADIVTEVSMAKAWIAEMANRVAYHCVQLHGGYGYMEEYPICRFYRDARAIPIFAGSTEVMKLIVARKLNLL
ncbi:acyl-CoA dehydrogenase family protein [Desulfoglaeba alkanexedens]|uniref:Acyl-CoA dehydrogenase n=1 Tax=Desulfoglaeba alkanexedens ALDC TaxID=980445 RepID=A0A4P8L525_9BACT|nr:acyl-CoA dehydrogenase family protein [Desulfoglaeba alkanexedens]QCQ23059.1 acyl-CoA dehydrogenase [Desulfoglaeba alkanexedens ALDC]